VRRTDDAVEVDFCREEHLSYFGHITLKVAFQTPVLRYSEEPDLPETDAGLRNTSDPGVC
jgi:hypothetical protein